MRLVDTSCWIHQLRRKGDPMIRARVEALLRAGEAAWCPAVRLEIWAGVGNAAERHVLRRFEEVLPELPITDAVWRAACELADRCRNAGKMAPATDILVAACARHHGVELEHADAHFDLLLSL